MKLSTRAKRVSAAIAVVVAGYICISAYGGYRAMEIPRLPLAPLPASIGLTPEDVSFPSRGGSVLLRGWLFPGAGEKAVVFVHGGYQNRVDDTVDTLRLARDLVDRGFNVLLFDLRGRGESEGRGLALSNIDADIGGALDFLSGRGFGAKKVGIIGFCSGAASAAIFASRNEVGAVVLDGCFAGVKSMLKRQASLAGVPGFFTEMFAPGMFFMVRLFFGYRPVNPVDVIGKVDSPVFFVYEALDRTIPESDVRSMFELSTNPMNELWIVPGALHSEGYHTVPSGYVQKISAFFDEALS